VTLATFGWVPLAIVIVAFLGFATGCETASASCSRGILPVQLGILTGALLALLVVPRLAYLAASGTLGLVAAAVALVAVYMVLGVAQPIPEPLVALALLVWIGGYLGAVVLAASDWPVPRPWRQRPALARATRVTR
jgi:hypothetical protein